MTRHSLSLPRRRPEFSESVSLRKHPETRRSHHSRPSEAPTPGVDWFDGGLVGGAGRLPGTPYRLRCPELCIPAGLSTVQVAVSAAPSLPASGLPLYGNRTRTRTHSVYPVLSRWPPVGLAGPRTCDPQPVCPSIAPSLSAVLRFWHATCFARDTIRTYCLPFYLIPSSLLRRRHTCCGGTTTLLLRPRHTPTVTCCPTYT